MALEIRLSFCGLDSVFFAIKAIAAAMAKKMSAPRGNISLATFISDGGEERLGGLQIRLSG
jgi:hypothetical protein